MVMIFLIGQLTLAAAIFGSLFYIAALCSALPHGVAAIYGQTILVTAVSLRLE